MKGKRQQSVSPETQAEAMRIAKGTQKPGQTKEQTKLIALGIQSGIELYKKQQKAKSRERDKLRKKQQKEKNQTEDVDTVIEHQIEYRQSWVPWGLLVISWLGFISYLFLYN
ncbi:DUF2956 domain-containing protein [Photobacterium damselae]|uniref:Protein of uncharacterized function (DUF2956) n=1 Tax=Photobacterium damselae TaxID=38293 RepID=A0A2T3QQH7_PHODM|nr:DUF2956 domain-containing protein [Photobacterium damselae]NVO62576.1 DUF2956 domain-containing protein [Photobacterium damselae subsp. damselae]PSB82656.1 DUF2956 domain-containing protein [Photobacterium damselae subsp. damselae]PSB90402.1 DUF2956 domain-containing protein [Photobacterium damselae subsp. damselae]PSW87352.1 DUF2956 domain-containing protein [Photobacterium damselae]SPY27558.1 Protein of uncharacterised function (DUF2956) [Photobacterium damselae]